MGQSKSSSSRQTPLTSDITSALYVSNRQSRQALLQHLPYHPPGKVSLPSKGLLQTLCRTGAQSLLPLRLSPRLPCLQVLKVTRPLPATPQPQLVVQGGHCTTKGQEFSPACDQRSPSSIRFTQETPALPCNAPAFLSDLYTAPHRRCLLFCCSLQVPEQEEGKPSWSRQGPSYANNPMVAGSTNSLLCHPAPPQHHRRNFTGLINGGQEGKRKINLPKSTASCYSLTEFINCGQI